MCEILDKVIHTTKHTYFSAVLYIDLELFVFIAWFPRQSNALVLRLNVEDTFKDWKESSLSE